MRKIYDFNAKTMPGGIVGRPRELAWPCRILTVAKPCVKAGGLKDINPFERCILKLLALRCYTPRDLAEETCLPPDLIAVILLRLFDRGKIDKDYRLTPDTLAEIENHESEPAFEYRTIYQFMDSLGGRKLQELDGPLKAEEVNDDGSIRKGPESLSLHHLLKQEHLPAGSDAGSCILRVRMVLRRNGDWRILNPFGKGWSKVLEASYQQFLSKTPEEEKKFSQWQEDNSRRFKKKHAERPTEPYDTEENRSRYPQLIATLNRRNYAGENEVDVFAALEWALFYSLQAVDLKQTIQLLTFDSIANNEARLAEAARQIFGKDRQFFGKDTEDPGLKRLRVPAVEKAKRIQNTERSEMQTVLPLAILAKDQLPLHLIADKYPDFLLRVLSDLSQRRNLQKHGKSHWSAIYGSDDVEFMRQVITVLLPSVVFSGLEVAQTDEDTVFDMQLSARRALQEDHFGVAQFNDMDSVLQDHLIQAQMFLQLNADDTDKENDDERIDALVCITNLYAAVECAFRPLIEDSHANFTSYEAIEEKTRKAGLGDLPAALKTIRPELLQKTLEGNDQTLGASVVVWLLQTEIEDLKQIAFRMPSFLTEISRLLMLRGHGNQICMIRRSELEKICKSIYKVIDIIKED